MQSTSALSRIKFMNDNSMTSCVISYACVGCYSGFLDESVSTQTQFSQE